jgi:predicted O-methyltransferase YrrM
MSYDERLNTYLQTLSRGLPPFLEDLEASALSERVPLIRKDTQDVIRMLLALHKPENILEIGTAVGFSAIFMCSCSDARIVTIENFPRRIREAEENIRKSGYGGRITLVPGDAQAILPTLEGPFDLALLDAAQGQYGSFLPELLRLLRSGGLLITDNVLIGGDLLESQYAVERRKRTIYKRMRMYMRELTGREDLVTSVLPVGDGLAVTVKK